MEGKAIKDELYSSGNIQWARRAHYQYAALSAPICFLNSFSLGYLYRWLRVGGAHLEKSLIVHVNAALRL